MLFIKKKWDNKSQAIFFELFKMKDGGISFRSLLKEYVNLDIRLNHV